MRLKFCIHIHPLGFSLVLSLTVRDAVARGAVSSVGKGPVQLSRSCRDT